MPTPNIDSNEALKNSKEQLDGEIKGQIKADFELEIKEQSNDGLKEKLLSSNSNDNNDEKESNDTDTKNEENRHKSPKNNDNYKAPKKGDKLGEKDNNKDVNNNNKNNLNNNLNNVKNNAKDKLNKAAEPLKKAANKGIDKAGGMAISAATGGVIPPKVGEKITKVAKKPAAKMAKNSMGNLGKKMPKLNKLNNLKNKNNLNNKNSNPKDDIKKVANKATRAYKVLKWIQRIKPILPAIGVAFLVLLIIGLVIGIMSSMESFLPGINGDVKEEEQIENYSKRDQKIINYIEKMVNKYPNVSTTTSENEDGEEQNSAAAKVLAVFAYPYYDLLQSDDVREYATGEVEDEEDEEDEEIEIDEEQAESSEDDEEDDGSDDDMYLDHLVKSKDKDNYEKLMKKYNELGDEGFDEYVKNEYMEDSESGYKKYILKEVQAEDMADAKEAIMADIESNINMFEPYIPERTCNTGTSTTSLGTGNMTEATSGEIVVKLKDYFATNGAFVKSDFDSAPFLYGTDTNPLPFTRYIFGVMYAESASCTGVESCAKTLMITAKSYALGRPKSMGFDIEEVDGKKVLTLRGNVGDQDFCDVYEGCNSGTYAKSTWSNFTGEGYNNRKDKMSAEQIANLEKWWNETADQYVTDASGNFTGSHYSDYNANCKKGNCVSQTRIKNASDTEPDYMNILFNDENGGFSNTSHTLYKATEGVSYAAETNQNVVCPSGNCGVSGTRDDVITFARSMVGKIVYYYAGKPAGKNYEDNNFGSTVAPDHKGRTIRGLDCSGFVDFVFWHVLDENFGLGNTGEIMNNYSTEIQYSDLKPGDIGFFFFFGSGTNQHVGIYAGKDSSGNDLWIDCNASNGVQEHVTAMFKVYFRPNVLNDTDNSNTNVCEATEGQRVCKTYNLSDSDIKGLAAIAYAEQGSPEGARAEASLMANKYEIDNSSKGLFEYVNSSSWWASASKGRDINNQEVIDAVKDALVNGHRSFPSYINEHDCISCGSAGFDITKIVLDGTTYTTSKDLLDKTKYVQEKTVIYNRYGSVYTFYSFPTESSDPFGYTKKLEDTCTAATSAGSGAATGKFVRPIQGNTTCNSYPTYSSGAWHGGGDIPTPLGTPVLAADGGTVEKVQDLGGSSYGKYILINHGNNYKTWYAHLSEFGVKEGDKVSQGQVIGKSGSTGNSTGPHLHFEARKGPGYSHTSDTINVCDYLSSGKSYSGG